MSSSEFLTVLLVAGVLVAAVVSTIATWVANVAATESKCASRNADVARFAVAGLADEMLLMHSEMRAMKTRIAGLEEANARSKRKAAEKTTPRVLSEKAMAETA